MARKWSRYPKGTFYAFTAPWTLGFLVLTAAPLVYGFAVSLTNFDGVSPRWRFVGLRNYAELLVDSDVWMSLLRTLGFAAIVVPLSVAGALGLAIMVNRRLRAQGVWRTIFFLPSVVPVVALAIMWKLILNRDAGILNAMLGLIGIEKVSWLTDPMAFYSLVLMTLWGLGGGMVIMLAALQNVPVELEEAAVIDGAGKWSVFWNVTVPMVSPILFFQVITGVIGALQMLVQPLLLTPAGGIAGVAAVPDSNRLYMIRVWEEFFLRNRFGFGSAMLWVYFLVILGLTLVLLRSSRSLVYYEVDTDGEGETR